MYEYALLYWELQYTCNDALWLCAYLLVCLCNWWSRVKAAWSSRSLKKDAIPKSGTHLLGEPFYTGTEIPVTLQLLQPWSVEREKEELICARWCFSS